MHACMELVGFIASKNDKNHRPKSLRQLGIPVLAVGVRFIKLANWGDDGDIEFRMSALLGKGSL